MRYRIAAAAIAACLGAPGAFAQDGTDDSQKPKETLAQFLARCDSDSSGCRSDLGSGIDAGEYMGMTCLPDGTSEDQAIDAELTWLRNAAAANTTLANDDEENAEYTALNMLWPCKD